MCPQIEHILRLEKAFWEVVFWKVRGYPYMTSFSCFCTWEMSEFEVIPRLPWISFNQAQFNALSCVNVWIWAGFRVNLDFLKTSSNHCIWTWKLHQIEGIWRLSRNYSRWPWFAYRKGWFKLYLRLFKVKPKITFNEAQFSVLHKDLHEFAAISRKEWISILFQHANPGI